MNRGRSLIILGVLVLAVGGVVWLLAGGRPTSGAVEDPVGDVSIGRGPKRPKTPRIVDVTNASVRFEDSTVVFEATVDGKLPESFRAEGATFDWELFENGTKTWIVSASIGIEATASMTATQFDHRSSTIDDTLPGRLDIEGRTVQISVDTERLDRFPSAFGWKLKTELDGDRTKAPSALATDVAPDEGSVRAGS